MKHLGKVEKYLVDLWRLDVLPGKQESEEEKAAGRPNSVFKLTGWRGAGWHLVFLDKPAK
jgi:hypothetical protein